MAILTPCKLKIIAWVLLVSIFSACAEGGNRQVGEAGIKDNSVDAAQLDSLSSRTTPDSAEDEAHQLDTIDISQYRKEVPPFKIRLVDGKGYTYKELDKTKPLILIYFQPDCPECQAFTAALSKRLDQLQRQQILMITFEDMHAVKAFDDTYKLSGHPNLKIGSEGYTFIVQKYYQIEHFPIVACFDSTGTLQRILNPRLAPEKLVDLLLAR